MRNLFEKAAYASFYCFWAVLSSCLGGPYVLLSSLGSIVGLFIGVAICLLNWVPISILSMLVGGPIAILSLPLILPAMLIISAVSILLLPLLPLLPMVALMLQFRVQVLALPLLSLWEFFFLWPPFCAVTFYYAFAFLLSTVNLSLLSIIETGPMFWRDLSRSVPSKTDSSHDINDRILVSDVLLHHLV